jgi:arylsulfatase A-like enzyme
MIETRPDPRRRTRRQFLKAAGLSAAAACALAKGTPTMAATDPAARRTNLIYVFADQLGTTRCGYAGDTKARTPVLDGFAAQGVDFRQAVSNTPVCSAHRASLLTGKYTTSTGMVINEIRMRTNHECFGHVLTRAGYQTGYVGKWHLYANQLGNHYDAKNSFVPPGPDRLGFDGYWAAYNFHHVYYGAYYHTDSPEKLSYGEGVYEPDGQTDLAIDFLGRAVKADKPFALFLSYGTPHDPWGPDNVPPKYLRFFEDVALANPPNYEPENNPYADGWGRLDAAERGNLPAWRRGYYAMVANLDWNLGRLFAAVDKAGLAENTIVAFSSDHGEMFGAHGRRAKNIFYEEAARVPFLVRWPGHVLAGSVSDACLATVDVMPTLLGLMGLPVPKAAEGMDLSHCALGRKGPEPEAALLQNTGACAAWENGYEWRALRDKRYTYAVYRRDKSELLFDNQGDPLQMRNLARDPAHGDALDRLRKQMAEKMKSLDDTFEACTWYRDHWTDGKRNIVASAKGKF